MSLSAYITPREVQDRMRVGDQDRLAQVLNLGDGEDPTTSPTLAQAIGAAGARIDASVVGRYSLPLAEPHPLLADIAFRLVRHSLLMGRNELLAGAEDTVRNDFRDALADLASIRSGDLLLSFPPVGETESLVPIQTVELGSSQTATSKRDFRSNLEAF